MLKLHPILTSYWQQNHFVSIYALLVLLHVTVFIPHYLRRQMVAVDLLLYWSIKSKSLIYFQQLSSQWIHSKSTSHWVLAVSVSSLSCRLAWLFFLHLLDAHFASFPNSAGSLCTPSCPLNTGCLLWAACSSERSPHYTTSLSVPRAIIISFCS